MTRPTVVASHQPDFLAYSGFYYKMAKADVFDLKWFDQYSRSGYQRRVQMRGSWTTLTLTDKLGSYARICDKRIDPIDASRGLIKTLQGRYSGAPYWRERGPEICDRIADISTDYLGWFNYELMLMVRDILGLRTPISIGPKPVGAKSAGIISVLEQYGPNVTYLSGTGARDYMGDCKEFTDAGIDVVWSKHKMLTGDSILTVIFDYADPLEIVLLEEGDQL